MRQDQVDSRQWPKLARMELSRGVMNQVQWYTPLIPELGKQEQVDLSLNPTWSTQWVAEQPEQHRKALGKNGEMKL